MNRSQKRKIISKGITTEELALIEKHSINTGMNEGFKHGAAAAQNVCNIAMLSVLHNEGFLYDKAGMEDFIGKFNSVIKSVEAGNTSIDSLKEILIKEYSLNL